MKICHSPLLVLDLLLYSINSIRGFNLECDGLSGEFLDEDLHATVQMGGEMACQPLDFVIRQFATHLQVAFRRSWDTAGRVEHYKQSVSDVTLKGHVRDTHLSLF